MSDLLIERGAVVIGAYRYCLTRDLRTAGRSAAIIMVNPSTADGTLDDPTIRKLYGFAQRNGIGRFAVANKFALRSEKVKALRTAADPVGPLNDAWIERVIAENDVAVVAWGTLFKLPQPLRGRWRTVAAIADRLGKPLHCLGTAGDGHPLHPLTLAYDNALRPWTPPPC